MALEKVDGSWLRYRVSVNMSYYRSLLFNDHLHLVEDFVIFGVIFGSRTERRNVVVRFSGIRGCRKGGKGMGEVFIEQSLGEVFMKHRVRTTATGN